MRGNELEAINSLTQELLLLEYVLFQTPIIEDFQ